MRGSRSALTMTSAPFAHCSTDRSAQGCAAHTKEEATPRAHHEDQVAYDKVRRTRAHPVPSKCIPRRVLEQEYVPHPLEEHHPRPKTRGECAGVPRPCPYVSCRHHLYLDVTKTGSIRLVFPDIEPGDMVDSCSLDVADRGGARDLLEIARLLNVTRQRVDQLQEAAQKKLRRLPLAREALEESFGRDEPQGEGLHQRALIFAKH